MRRSASLSARGVALAAALFALVALGVAGGCGQETFDLLAAAGASGAGLSGAPSAGAGSAGSTQASAGGAGEVDIGKAGALGFGGRLNMPPNGGSAGIGGNEAPCTTGEPCQEGLACNESTPFCTACDGPKDCSSENDRYCDAQQGRCVECQRNSDCGEEHACNVALGRCTKACKGHVDCAQEGDRVLCDPKRGLCVECLESSHCVFFGVSDDFCFAGACVECFDNRQCASKLCVAGRCQNKH